MSRFNLRISFFLGFFLVFAAQGCKDEPSAPQKPPQEEDFWELKGFPDKIIRNIKIAPNGTIFAETPGSILRSGDNGENWTVVLNEPTEGPLALGPDGEVYAAGLFSLYSSYDYGQTWSSKDMTDSSDGIDAATPIYSINAAKDGAVYLGVTGGILKSLDRGHTWKYCAKGAEFSNIISFLNTSNGDIIAGGNTIFNVIHISKDHGQTWVASNNLSHQLIFSLAEDALGRLYAGGMGGLFRSGDGGINWDVVTTTNSRINSIVIDKSNYVYTALTDAAMFVSKDDCLTWNVKSGGLKKPDSRCLAMDKNGYIYLGTDGYGIYKSRKPVY